MLIQKVDRSDSIVALKLSIADFCNKICHKQTLARLFDHLVSDRQQIVRNFDTERLRRLASGR